MADLETLQLLGPVLVARLPLRRRALLPVELLLLHQSPLHSQGLLLLLPPALLDPRRGVVLVVVPVRLSEGSDDRPRIELLLGEPLLPYGLELLLEAGVLLLLLGALLVLVPLALALLRLPVLGLGDSERLQAELRAQGVGFLHGQLDRLVRGAHGVSWWWWPPRALRPRSLYGLLFSESPLQGMSSGKSSLGKPARPILKGKKRERAGPSLDHEGVLLPRRPATSTARAPGNPLSAGEEDEEDVRRQEARGLCARDGPAQKREGAWRRHQGQNGQEGRGGLSEPGRRLQHREGEGEEERERRTAPERRRETEAEAGEAGRWRLPRRWRA